jgi:hypothetical protein
MAIEPKVSLSFLLSSLRLEILVLETMFRDELARKEETKRLQTAISATRAIGVAMTLASCLSGEDRDAASAVRVAMQKLVQSHAETDLDGIHEAFAALERRLSTVPLL